MATPVFLRVKEMADVLGISAPTLRAWTKSGRIPYIRAVEGGVVLFEPERVLLALRSGNNNGPTINVGQEAR